MTQNQTQSIAGTLNVAGVLCDRLNTLGPGPGPEDGLVCEWY